MVRIRHAFCAGICATAALALAAPAQASTGFGALPLAVAAAAFGQPQACPASVQPALGMVRQDISVSPASKAAAILGGQVSQLELIARQQAATVTQPQTALASLQPLEPAAGPSLGFPLRRQDCQSQLAGIAAMPLVQPALARVVPGPTASPYSPNDFLASKRLEIRHTGFDSDWNRVRREGLSASYAEALVPVGHGHPGMAALGAVNSWANARIRYVEDRDLYGRADYWASAGETLRRGAGDCEDIAIAKMQLLAAIGVPRSDMYLTIARDLARNADHALLVVKLDGRNWLLDNSTDQVLDASASYDYRPIMSFNEGHKWLHGY